MAQKNFYNTVNSILKKKSTLYVLSFLIPFTIYMLIGVLLRLYPFGDNTLLTDDMHNQFVSFFMFFKNVITSNNDFFYTFSKNLGGDMVGFSAYYLQNPFLFILFLFPDNLIPLGIYIMTALMLSTASLTFMIFIQNAGLSVGSDDGLGKGLSDDTGDCSDDGNGSIFNEREAIPGALAKLIFSVSYGMMGFVVAYYILPIWFCNIILLPLVILGFHKMMGKDRSRQGILIYVITLAASIVCNFYFGYMICLFLVIYFVYYCISCYEKNDDESYIVFSFNKLKTMIVFSCLSVALSAFNLIPVVLVMGGERGQADSSIFEFRRMFRFIDLYRAFLPKTFLVEFSRYYLPHLYIGIIPLVFVIAFFVIKKYSRKEKIASLFIILVLILSLYIMPLNMVWHAFSKPSGFLHRFAFLLSFFLLTTGYKGYVAFEEYINKQCSRVGQYSEAKKSRGTEQNNSVAQNRVTEQNSEIGQNREIKQSRNNIALIFEKATTRVIACCLVFLLALLELSYVSYNVLNAGVSGAVSESRFAEYHRDLKPVISHIKSLEDENSLYRMEKDVIFNMNDPMALDFTGLSHYSSCDSIKVKEFLGKMGFRIEEFFSFYNQGSTAFADSLLGVKYFISRFDSTDKPYGNYIYDENSLYVYENPYSLGLASIGDSDRIRNVDDEENNAFIYQNEVAKCFGINNNIYNEATVSDITVCGDVNLSDEFINRARKNGADINYTDSGEINIENQENPCFVEFSVNIKQAEQTLYMYFGAPEMQGARIFVNGVDYDDYFSDWRWAVEQVGTFKEGDTVAIRIEGTSGKLDLNDYHLYHQDNDVLKEWYEKACDNGSDSVSLTKVKSSHITGEFRANKDGMLLFSIPYDKAWKIKIDGNIVSQEEVLHALMGIEVTEGNHTIEMRYIPSGLIAGSVISLIALCILALMMFYKRNKTTH